VNIHKLIVENFLKTDEGIAAEASVVMELVQKELLPLVPRPLALERGWGSISDIMG
jgi:hypothetical protein